MAKVSVTVEIEYDENAFMNYCVENPPYWLEGNEVSREAFQNWLTDVVENDITVLPGDLINGVIESFQMVDDCFYNYSNYITFE